MTKNKSTKHKLALLETIQQSNLKKRGHETVF